MCRFTNLQGRKGLGQLGSGPGQGWLDGVLGVGPPGVGVGSGSSGLGLGFGLGLEG